MNTIRASIKDVLEVIASKEEQVDYARRVPVAEVTAELVCMWFDDIYHHKSRQHKEAFSIEEQEALSNFNAFYDARVDSLPKTLAELQIDSQWDEIVHEARKVLTQINW
jgi:hypothetical protein